MTCLHRRARSRVLLFRFSFVTHHRPQFLLCFSRTCFCAHFRINHAAKRTFIFRSHIGWLSFAPAFWTLDFHLSLSPKCFPSPRPRILRSAQTLQSSDPFKYNEDKDSPSNKTPALYHRSRPLPRGTILDRRTGFR